MAVVVHGKIYASYSLTTTSALPFKSWPTLDFRIPFRFGFKAELLPSATCFSVPQGM